MPRIQYRLILEKYLLSDDESEDEHKVLHKYSPIEVNAIFDKDSCRDKYKYRKLLREDMYKKIDDLCVSLEESESMANEEKPTAAQIAYATYLAQWMCVGLPKEHTKEAYSAFIDKWKPFVVQEDRAMNEPDEWQWQYS